MVFFFNPETDQDSVFGWDLLSSTRRWTEVLDKTSLVASAIILEGREVIKKIEVLEKLIEKNRMLSEQSAV